MTKNSTTLMTKFAEWAIDVNLPDGTQLYLELDYARKPYPLTKEAYGRLKSMIALTSDIEPSFLAKILRGENLVD